MDDDLYFHILFYSEYFYKNHSFCCWNYWHNCDSKNKNLPKHLFFDSRQNDFGDKDKLTHFFGNAFLAYSISFFNLSKFLGILVELIEDAFSKGGLVDWKDITINHLGELFGSNLDDNKNLLPSEILKIYSILFYKHSNI